MPAEPVEQRSESMGTPPPKHYNIDVLKYVIAFIALGIGYWFLLGSMQALQAETEALKACNLTQLCRSCIVVGGIA